MNNNHLYDLNAAGGIDYPETERYQYDIWHTTPGLTDAAEFKSVRFQMVQQNLLLHWKYAYLEIHGRLTESNGTAYTDASNIAPIFNAIPYLFTNAKFSVGTRVVENVNVVGPVSSLMHYVLNPRSLSKNAGLQFMWVPDTKTTAETDNKGWEARRAFVIKGAETAKGTFKFRMPLNLIFGFCENFVALKGYGVEVELIRGQDYKALFLAAGTNAGKFTFKSMSLNIPVVTGSNAVNVKILEGLKHPKPYNFSFRGRNGLTAKVPKDARIYQLTITTENFAERPQMIFVGFQKTNANNQTFNYATFSHENVETMHIKMNNVTFPTHLVSSNWKENDNGMWYEYLLHCRANYLQFSGLYTDNTFLNPDNFKNLYTVYCFDVSKQHDLVSSRTVSCELHATFREAIAEHTNIYVAWYYDRTLELFTDGQSINVKSSDPTYTHGN